MDIEKQEIETVKLIEEADADLHIEYSGDIGKQVADQMSIFTKWAKRLKQASYELNLHNIKGEKLNADLWMYYTGKADPQVYRDRPMDNRFLKSEVKEAISADEIMMKHKIKGMLISEKVKTLEMIVQQIKDRGWALKNITEWKKFMSGD